VNAEVGRVNIFKQTTGNGSVNETNNYGPISLVFYLIMLATAKII